jgi:hypothetical protein
MSTIKSSTTTTTAYSVEADTTGTLVLQTGATPTTAVTVAANQSVTFAQAANLPNTFGFKNRIINGAMVIDQRNAGASITQNGTYPQYSLDRWLIYGPTTSKFTVQQNAGSVTPPAGFSKYLGVTSLSAYSIVASDIYEIRQGIEGFNTADLGWGTASAQTVTLSFWVRSSLTGTFGGALGNEAVTRGYPFTYIINSANTWEQKSITILGDTTGTWVGATNGCGINIYFGLGVGSTYSGTAGAWAGVGYYSATGATSVVGTNGATFYITGVQLEKGSTATSFDYRSITTELQLCQRYYEKSYRIENAVPTNSVNGYMYAVATKTLTGAGTNERGAQIFFNTLKRAAPTMTYYTYTNSTAGSWEDGGGNAIAVFTASSTQGGANLYNNANVAINTYLIGQWVASIEL